MDASVSASARLASAPVVTMLERGVERQPALFFAHSPETPELRARGIDAVPRAFPLNQRRRLPAGPHSRDGREDGRLGRIGRAAGPRRQRPEQVVAEPSRQSSVVPALRRHLDGREAGGERQPGRSGQHSRAMRAFDDPERGLVAGDGRPAKRKGLDRAEPRSVLRGFCKRARLRRAQPLEREHQRRKRREPAKRGRGRRRIGRRPLAEHALREQDRIEAPAPERKGDARDARGEPRGVDRRRLAVARRFARLHRGERHVDRRCRCETRAPRCGGPWARTARRVRSRQSSRAARTRRAAAARMGRTDGCQRLSAKASRSARSRSSREEAGRCSPSANRCRGASRCAIAS